MLDCLKTYSKQHYHFTNGYDNRYPEARIREREQIVFDFTRDEDPLS